MDGAEFEGSDAKGIVRRKISSGSLVKVQFTSIGVASILGEKDRGGKGKVQMFRGRSEVAQIHHFLLGIGNTEHRDIINGGDEGANEFSAGDTVRATEFGGSGAIEDVSDVGPKTKERVVALNRELVVALTSERTGSELELGR